MQTVELWGTKVPIQLDSLHGFTEMSKLFETFMAGQRLEFGQIPSTGSEVMGVYSGSVTMDSVVIAVLCFDCVNRTVTAACR